MNLTISIPYVLLVAPDGGLTFVFSRPGKAKRLACLPACRCSANDRMNSRSTSEASRFSAVHALRKASRSSRSTRIRSPASFMAMPDHSPWIHVCVSICRTGLATLERRRRTGCDQRGPASCPEAVLAPPEKLPARYRVRPRLLGNRAPGKGRPRQKSPPVLAGRRAGSWSGGSISRSGKN